jgi:hypothetical protein
MNPERLEEEIFNYDETNNKYEKIIKKNNVFIGYTKKEKNISNITISAAVTAKGRIKLYKGMMGVIKSGGRLLYTDTDSIIAAYDRNIYKNILNKNLGEVYFNEKLEDTVIYDAVFAMPKTYALKLKDKEILKLKGFTCKPNFNDFKKAFYNKEDIETENIE